MVLTVGHEHDPAKRIRQRQGARLRDTRRLRNLTLRQLADRMCAQEGITVTPQAISQWENGTTTPRQHMQVAIARALDVPPSLIFSLDTEAGAA